VKEMACAGRVDRRASPAVAQRRLRDLVGLKE
jgi:hypothetical protein